MENPIVATMVGLLISMALAIEGAILHGPTMNLLHYPMLVLAAIRAATITARDNYETGKQTLRALREVLAQERIKARTLATLVRDILKPLLGTEYSSAWDITGFVGSLEVPQRVEELLVLLETM